MMNNIVIYVIVLKLNVHIEFLLGKKIREHFYAHLYLKWIMVISITLLVTNSTL